jgi:hypothetical protein
MFFRTSLVVVVLVSALAPFFGGGCSRFLNEKKDAKQDLQLESAKFICLKDLPAHLSKFAEGSLQEKELRDGLDCTRQALTFFSDKTIGSNRDGYSPEDLRRFFGKYFLKENNLTLGLMIQIFKVKKMLFGGTDDNFTKPEIAKVVNLLDVLKEPLVSLAPFMPVVLMDAHDVSLEQLTKTSERLTNAVVVLIHHADLLTSQYEFEDFDHLLTEVDQFVSKDKTESAFKSLHENRALIQAAKNIFIGETPRFDGLEDWERAAKTLTGLHRAALYYHYFFDVPEASGREKLRAETLMADEFINVLEQSLPMSQQGRIPFKTIDAIFTPLEARKSLPFGLSAGSLKNLYKTIILRALDPKRKGDGRDLNALELGHLAVLKEEWHLFKLHQNFLNALPFDKNQSVGVTDLAKGAANETALRSQLKTFGSDGLAQTRLWQGWLDGRELLLKEYPTVYDASGRAVIRLNPQSLRQTWSSLTRWNVVRALSRLMMIGYGKHGTNHGTLELAKDVILVEGLQQWYDEFREVGIEIKAFDPRSGNSGSRSFKEANFFTFKGDGNSEMSAEETFDFVSLLVSGGLVSAENLRVSLSPCALAEKDVFGFPWLNESCFKDRLRRSLADSFGNLPGLVKEVQNMSAAQWNEFYENLMSASRTSPANGGRVETADIRTAVMILHYTESLMVVYDRDGNGVLDVDEVRLAAPRFRQFISTASPEAVQKLSHLWPSAGNAVTEDFFLYLVFRGHKPEPPLTDYTGKFQGEKLSGSLGEVSRAKILRVFKILKDEAAKQ